MTFKNFDELLEVVRKESPKEGFSAIASNPPYQMAVEGDSNNRSYAIYHHFMRVSKEIGNKVTMIYPARWMHKTKGEGIDDFRDEELKSKHYAKFYDFSSSKNIFENVEIAGGLNYFLWKKEESESLDYYYNGIQSQRKNISNDAKIMLRDPIAVSTFAKVNTENAFKDIASALHPFGPIIANEERILALPSKEDNKVGVWCISNSGRTKLQVDKTYVSGETDSYKVFVSKTANRAGGITYPRQDRIFIGEKNEACSLSFLKIGNFANRQEAVNCLLYMKTDFANFLFAIITPTQDALRSNYALIPNVNFVTGEILDKPGTFLDFTKPETLDDQLAVIYNLTENERNLMKKDLKPWKDKISVTADM